MAEAACKKATRAEILAVAPVKYSVWQSTLSTLNEVPVIIGVEDDPS